MVGTLPRALTTGFPAGVTIAGLAIAAHASAGGDVAGAGSLIAVAVCVLAAVALGTAIRWTFTPILIAATAVQPLLHMVLEGHSGHSAHSPHDAHHNAVAVTGGGGADPRMLVTHGLLAIVGAVAIRWGVRWLRSMPALARELLPHPSAWAGVLPIVATIGAPTEVIACDRHSLSTWTNRGPPG